jgi:hypothetical protein
VIAAIGVGFGHIDDTILTIILFTLMITLTASTYVINYSQKIYTAVAKVFNLLHIKDNLASEADNRKSSQGAPIMFLGSNKIANSLFN